MKREGKLEEEKTGILSAQSSHPQGQHVSSKDNTLSTDQDIKAERKQKTQTKVSSMTTRAAIASHYNPPIKSFTACLGGESVAGMIHHCSVSQITASPSPPHCSSESQINWPDTSNDSAWKRRHGL